VTRRLALIGLLSAFVWLRCAFPARAQLAQSFYNITAISTKPLPNGVQVTIETDGTVEWGVDRKEFLDIPPGQDWGPPRLLTAFRLRFVGARAAVSAYNTIGIYPVDAAEVALGQDELDGQPAFSQGRDRSRGNPAIPRVDITFRLFVPVRVSRLTFRYGGYNPWVMDDDRYVGPREVGIESSPDRRSLILTFITDRNDTLRGEPRLHRSPAEGQSHRRPTSSRADTT